MKYRLRQLLLPCGFWLATLFSLSAFVHADTVYRYQDKEGRWHFSDRKPKQDHEVLQLGKATPERPVPRIEFVKNTQGSPVLLANNPLRAPVQFQIQYQGKQIAEWIVAAHSQEPMFLNGQPFVWKEGYEYSYRMGRPITASDGRPLQAPVPPNKRYRISQSFNGNFSHQTPQSQYAVDLVMPVGEGIHAARDGIVIEVKDDYHMGGADRFFLDKANYIQVLHDDDTFAIYAHLLLGSAVVKEGDRVRAGDLLASVGSTGFSTGPHLHFVLQRNDGEQIVSEPFRFQLGQEVFKPEKGQWVYR